MKINNPIQAKGVYTHTLKEIFLQSHLRLQRCLSTLNQGNFWYHAAEKFRFLELELSNCLFRNWSGLVKNICAKALWSCPTLWGPVDCSSSGSSVHGILQTRMLKWVACLLSPDLPHPGIESTVSCIAGRLFTCEPPGKPIRYNLTMSI